MTCYRIISALILTCAMVSCAAIRPAKDVTVTPAERSGQVRDLLDALRAQNETLVNFKGVGNITISQNGRLQFDQRVAWIGEKPVKFSIAVLISGYPAVKLAADGQWLYYLEVQGQDTLFRKLAANDPDLKRLISIPISVSDIISLLSGRIPLAEFDAVTFVQDPSQQGPILILTDNWWGVRQKIAYDASLSLVQQVDVFHRSGSLKYRAEIDGTQQIDGFTVPRRLRLSNNDGIDFQLDIHRYWVNVDVAPSVFVLTPPD
ncbi:MAG: hypothetical protein QNJ26_10825 [Desulfobacterales bacterium]|nr:hypothetical protein [Desulfobacterales bacterium]